MGQTHQGISRGCKENFYRWSTSFRRNPRLWKIQLTLKFENVTLLTTPAAAPALAATLAQMAIERTLAEISE